MNIAKSSRCAWYALIALQSVYGQQSQPPAWNQWGGPQRNFVVDTDGLAESWPQDGPPVLWKRPLGHGHSGIVGDKDRIYTMYRSERQASDESVIALDAKTGKTIWEKRYSAALPKPVDTDGKGPNSTPLIVGKNVYAIGTNAVVRCFDKETGKLIWTRDLCREFNSPALGGYGYSVSPLAYKDLLIVPLGYRPPPTADGDDTNDEPSSKNANCSVIALRLSDGKLVWESSDYVVWQSSPSMIRFRGQDQIVVLMTDAVAALNPLTGVEIWRLTFEDSSLHCMTPWWNGKNLLVFASGGSGEGRAIELFHENGKTVARERWANHKMISMIYIGVEIDNTLFMPGNSRFYGFNLTSGERKWIERGFDSPSCLFADGKLLILDRNGVLTIARPKADGLEVLSQCQAMQRDALTCPTLIGQTLYIRDRESVVALDLGTR